MALDRYGDVLPRSILKPRSAGDGNAVYVALSFADEPELVRLQDAMRRSGIKAEWQDPGLFHCSLLIVEDATDEQVNGLLDGPSLPVRFWVEVASLGTFEADDIPLIANVVANPALIRLQQEFGAAALRQGLPVFEFFRATSWKPHITLGYDSDAEIEKLPTLAAIIKLRAEAVLLMRDDYNVVRRILLPATMPDRAFVEAGGKGSGFYGHAGRPGEVGGSLPSGEVAEEAQAQSSIADQRVTKEVAAEWLRVNATDFTSEDRDRMAGFLAEWGISMRTMYRCQGIVTAPPAGYTSDGRWYNRPELDSVTGKPTGGSDLCDGVFCPWDGTIHLPDNLGRGNPETFYHTFCHEYGHLVTEEFWGGGGSEAIYTRIRGRLASMTIPQRLDFYRRTGLRPYSFFENYGEFRADSFMVSRLGTPEQREALDRMWRRMEEGVPSTWRTEPEPLVTVWEPIERKVDGLWLLEYIRTEVPETLARSCPLYLHEDPHQSTPAVTRHYGPGPHPGTGTDQSVHAGGGVSEEARPGGTGAGRTGSRRARYKPVMTADGMTALAAMPQTQTWQPVWEGLEAIDQVHRMPPYMRDLLQRTAKPGQLPFERSRSEIRTGGYWQINGDGAKKIGIDLEETGYGAGQDPPHPQMTTVHEVGHFLDNVLFGDPSTGGRASMGRGERVGPSGNAVVNLDQQFEDVIVAMRESVDYQMLLGQNLGYFTVEGLSGHFEYPARAAMRVRQPVEMFSRGYAQWIALRSGNAVMRAQIDDRNALADRGGPRLQWDWRNFELIAGAYDRLFQAAGLLRSTP